MYEAIHVDGRGVSTAARFASTAAQYGFRGIVYRGGLARPQIERLRNAFDLDVVRGVTITGRDRDQITAAIDRERSQAEILIVQTEDPELVRFVANRERVDVLAGIRGIEHTTAKVARDHGVALEIDLGPVLRESGAPRSEVITELRRLERIVAHFDVPFVVSGRPHSHLQVRAPRELVGVGKRCGFTEEAIEEGLEHWGHIVARTRRNRDDRFIEPDVRVVDDEANAG